MQHIGLVALRHVWDLTSPNQGLNSHPFALEGRLTADHQGSPCILHILTSALIISLHDAPHLDSACPRSQSDENFFSAMFTWSVSSPSHTAASPRFSAGRWEAQQSNTAARAGSRTGLGKGGIRPKFYGNEWASSHIDETGHKGTRVRAARSGWSGWGGEESW